MSMILPTVSPGTSPTSRLPRPLALRAAALLFGAASLSACAQAPGDQDAAPGEPAAISSPGEPQVAPGTPDARARDAIRALNSQLRIDRIGPAPVPGFREVIVGGQVVYVTDDGKYLMQGTLIDVASKESMGEAAMAALRLELLATVPDADKIVFAPAAPEYTVTVFTDVECGYCRRFHESIAEYNREGIAVEYLAFPRMGPGSEDFEKMVSVWCAADRRRALTEAKADRPVPGKDCKNPVAMHYSLGQRAGLTGTPMILGQDGRQLGGYLPPGELRAALDERYGKDAGQAPAEQPAATSDAGAR